MIKMHPKKEKLSNDDNMNKPGGHIREIPQMQKAKKVHVPTCMEKLNRKIDKKVSCWQKRILN